MTFFFFVISLFLVKRAANTGWGQKEDRRSRWGHDKFDGSTRNGRQSSGRSGRVPESPSYDDGSSKRYEKELERKDRDKRERDESHDRGSKWHDELKYREERNRRDEKRARRYESESYHRDDKDSRSKDTYDEYHRHRSHR